MVGGVSAVLQPIGASIRVFAYRNCLFNAGDPLAPRYSRLFCSLILLPEEAEKSKTSNFRLSNLDSGPHNSKTGAPAGSEVIESRIVLLQCAAALSGCCVA
jgi:hypothetical protein